MTVEILMKLNQEGVTCAELFDLSRSIQRQIFP